MKDFLDSDAGQFSAAIASVIVCITLMGVCLTTVAKININATHKNDVEKYQLVTQCRMKATDPDKVCGELPNFGNTKNN